MIGKCVYCQEPKKKLSEEHLIPKFMGGCKHQHNILMACIPCNTKRDKQPLYRWLEGRKELIVNVVARKIIKAIDCLVKRHRKAMVENVTLNQRCEILTTKLNKMGNINHKTKKMGNKNKTSVD